MRDAEFRVVKVAAPLRHQVLESLRSAMISGRLPAGERLVERELCEMTGVSRTLIREALRQLEAEGLVAVLPNRGPIVASISPDDAKKVYQVRGELEGLASRLFAENATDDQIAALQETFANLRAAYATGVVALVLAAKKEFYDQLIAGSGNEILGALLRQVQGRAMSLRSTSLSRPGRLAESEAEIAAMVQAIARRDGAGARAASEVHVQRAAEAALGMTQGSAP